jgi:hypothetical protein
MRDVTSDLMRFLSITGLDDGEVTDVEPEPPPQPQEPKPEVRRDSRGRILRGSPDEVVRAAHMRRVAAERKAEREAARQAAIEAAREAIKNGATEVALPDIEPPPSNAFRPQKSKIPPQKIKRGF